MIEETDYGMTASCDFCSTEIELQTRDFLHAVKSIKNRGWKVFQNEKGEWQHKCPCCLEDEHESE